MATIKKVAVTVEIDDGTTITVTTFDHFGGNPRFLNQGIDKSLNALEIEIAAMIASKYGIQER